MSDSRKAAALAAAFVVLGVLAGGSAALGVAWAVRVYGTAAEAARHIAAPPAPVCETAALGASLAALQAQTKTAQAQGAATQAMLADWIAREKWRQNTEAAAWRARLRARSASR